ncbi:hypothetical protein HYN48_13065 [Flavobacterium magnum]|uniref:Uncharacterized protein n=1 Tax=Flavobacterium magnum TaxID=2162713 RepID=A0A2S0RHC8_9FLAO|nr:hypothetical protein [Flavobacterium magnum]AWA30929.1 hypothetical protein HYN48_13065 [Flavobacterium magnum]
MSTYQHVYRQFEKGFLGSCVLSVLLQSCVGGITAMKILQHGAGLSQMLQLFVVVIASLAVNGAIISVQSPKTVFNLLVGAQAICFLLIVANFFQWL